jgi:hypothetical protein
LSNQPGPSSRCYFPPGALNRPFIVLLEQDRTDETNDRFLVGKDADHFGTPLDWPDVHAENFAPAVAVDADRDGHRDRDDAAVLAAPSGKWRQSVTPVITIGIDDIAR